MLPAGPGVILANPFQSAPGFEAGRCYLLPIRRAVDEAFQSAPGFEAGRCGHRVMDGHHVAGVSIRARL